MDERLIRLVTIITPPAPRNSQSLANNVYKWFMKDEDLKRFQDGLF